jgi:hypothetical protein
MPTRRRIGVPIETLEDALARYGKPDFSAPLPHRVLRRSSMDFIIAENVGSACRVRIISAATRRNSPSCASNPRTGRRIGTRNYIRSKCSPTTRRCQMTMNFVGRPTLPLTSPSVRVARRSKFKARWPMLSGRTALRSRAAICTAWIAGLSTEWDH